MRLMIGTVLIALSFCQFGAKPKICKNELNTPAVRKEYKNQQLFVNEGHEPWRLDSNAVASEYLFSKLGVPQAQWDVYRSELHAIAVSDRRAVFEYFDQTHQTCFRVTVGRYKWLLAVARRWEWMIWVPESIDSFHCTKQAS